MPKLTLWSRLTLRLHPTVTEACADHDSVYARTFSQQPPSSRVAASRSVDQLAVEAVCCCMVLCWPGGHHKATGAPFGQPPAEHTLLNRLMPQYVFPSAFPQPPAPSLQRISGSSTCRLTTQRPLCRCHAWRRPPLGGGPLQQRLAGLAHRGNGVWQHGAGGGSPGALQIAARPAGAPGAAQRGRWGLHGASGAARPGGLELYRSCGATASCSLVTNYLTGLCGIRAPHRACRFYLGAAVRITGPEAGSEQYQRFQPSGKRCCWSVSNALGS